METVIDNREVRHDFVDPPRRIVSLVPSLSETVAELAGVDALIGVTRFCKHPAGLRERIATVGGTKDPDIRKIAALQPDLVLVNEEENRMEDYEKLRSAGLPVFATGPRTFTEGLTLLRQIGRILGRVREADAIATAAETRAEKIRAERPGRGLRLFYPVWNRPLMTISGDTYIHDVITLFGFANPFAPKRDRYPEITEAELEKALPQVIVLPDEPYEFRPEHRADWLMKSQYPAARRLQVHLADGSYFCWYGVRQLAALSYIQRLLT